MLIPIDAQAIWKLTRLDGLWWKQSEHHGHLFLYKPAQRPTKRNKDSKKFEGWLFLVSPETHDGKKTYEQALRFANEVVHCINPPKIEPVDIEDA